MAQRIFLAGILNVTLLLCHSDIGAIALLSSTLISCTLAFKLPIRFLYFFAIHFGALLLHYVAYFGWANDNGLLVTATQDSTLGVTDSQYFLYIATTLVEDFNLKTLFVTWGSAFPIFVGYVALLLFKDPIGILLINSAFYTLSILILFDTFRNSVSPRMPLLIFIALLPYPLLYNIVPSKEPLFLFMISSGLYLIAKVKGKHKPSMFLAVVPLYCGLAMLFRPILFPILASYYFFGSKNLIKVALRMIALMLPALGVLYSLFIYLEVPLPLFFLSNNSFIGLAAITEMQQGVIDQRGYGSMMQLFSTFPYSVVLSPIGILIWLNSGLLSLTDIPSALYTLLQGYDFISINIIVKVADNLALLFFVAASLLSKFGKRNHIILLLPAVLVVFIVSFQFFESARHKYIICIFASLWYGSRRQQSPVYGHDK